MKPDLMSVPHSTRVPCTLEAPKTTLYASRIDDTLHEHHLARLAGLLVVHDERGQRVEHRLPEVAPVEQRGGRGVVEAEELVGEALEHDG
eukprot:5871178-Prymnesium_polylepis.1